MQKISVEPMSRDKIRQLAKKFRKIFGLEETLRFPIVQFIEWILPELGLDFEVVPVEELGNAYGVTHTQKGIMTIREDVYDRAVDGNARDRFTLCHDWDIFYCILLRGLALHVVKYLHIWIQSGRLMSLQES